MSLYANQASLKKKKLNNNDTTNFAMFARYHIPCILVIWASFTWTNFIVENIITSFSKVNAFDIQLFWILHFYCPQLYAILCE